MTKNTLTPEQRIKGFLDRNPGMRGTVESTVKSPSLIYEGFASFLETLETLKRPEVEALLRLVEAKQKYHQAIQNNG